MGVTARLLGITQSRHPKSQSYCCNASGGRLTELLGAQLTNRTTSAAQTGATVESVRTVHTHRRSAAVSEHVYIQSNEPESNRVLAFRREPDGMLIQRGTFSTGGAGTGSPHLQSQGSIVLTRDSRHLLVTNAGSGHLSVFATGDDALTLLHTIPTGGGTPRSVTEQGGLVYVLNTDGASLAGFRLQNGGLDPIRDAPRALPEGSDPAQVGFIPDGTGIVVTNRGTDSITLYPVDDSGRLGEPVEQPSSGPTPYGFAFANDGTLVVTEAFGAQKGKAAAPRTCSAAGRSGRSRARLGTGEARSAGPS
jgi:6-phosphogluconolactonase